MNFWPSVCSLAAMKMCSGFSWPSTAPEASAGCASAQVIWVGLAPSAVNVSLKIGEPTTRNFRPFMSAGVRISRLEFVTSRKPFSPQASGTTPAFSTTCRMRLPTSPCVSASRPAWSWVKNGSENRFSSLTCGDQLMVEPTAMSITPWRIALNSRVWSPLISDTPG